MHILKSILLIYFFFYTTIILASSRKVSFNLSEQNTILTEYINLSPRRSASFYLDDQQTILTEYGDFSALSLNRSRSDSVPTILDIQRNAPSLNYLPNSIFTIDEITLSFNSCLSNSINTIQVPSLDLLLNKGIQLNSASILEEIKNNNDFRREKLNNYSNYNNHYILINDKVENNYKLIGIDDTLHIKRIKIVTAEEIENIVNIEEEILYNTILYEIPSQVFSTSISLQSIVTKVKNRTPNTITGVSSSKDYFPGYDIWITGISEFANQKKSEEVDAFKSRNNSGIIGFDILLDENTIAGIAYAMSKNNTKFVSSSSKEKTNFQTLTIYTNNNEKSVGFFYSLTSGMIFIKNLRDLFYNNKIITSKHNGKLIDFNTNIYKKYDFRNNFITPQLGINYNYIYFKPFKENGVLISKNIEQKIAVRPMITVGKNLYHKNLKIIPSLYYELTARPFYKQKRANITILHNSQVLSAKCFKYKQNSHKVGAELKLQNTCGNIYVNYDLSWERKAYSHSVGVGLKWDF